MTGIRVCPFACAALAFLAGHSVLSRAQDLLANTYGGSGYEYAYSIQQTADGGYVFTGPSDSASAGLWDFWIVKLDASGNVSWQRTYGGSADDVPNCIKQTADGGYIVAGRTQSFGVSGGMDAWVLKLDSSGNRTWQRSFGGSGNYDAAYSVVQNDEGGYYVAGWTNSYGAGLSDYWVIKLDSAGNSLWQKALGGSSNDCAYTCCLSGDGGVVVAGGAAVGAGGFDVWVVKLNSSGSVVWQKAFGGTADDLAFSIQRTADDGFIVAGFTKSFGAGNEDFWVLKLDASGGLTWQRTYGSTQTDWAFAVTQAADGGYFAAGRTTSFGAGTDVWLLRLNAAGNAVWQRNYGSSGIEYAYCVWPAADGSFMVGGITGSFGAVSYDAMVLKLESSCMLGPSCPYFSTTAVTPGTPSPTTTTTNRSPTTTSCTSSTTAPASTSWVPTKRVQCTYPILPDESSILLSVTKAGDDPYLSWTAPSGSCTPTGYGVYRGTLPIASYDHSSLDCTVTDLVYEDLSSGDNQYYLVVPLNLTLEGSYGTASDGTEIPPGAAPCRPRCLLLCP